MTKSEAYFARCEKAVGPLTQGKRITVELALLAEHGVDPRQWLTDLHNSVVVEFYDPADCFPDSCSPEYKVSVLVRGSKAIASAKRTN